MRKALVAGNWKMNSDLVSAEALAGAVIDSGKQSQSEVEVVLLPPSPFLTVVYRQLKEKASGVFFGAQNSSEYENGAYTGEVSAEMLASLGCAYCLVGHSERRQLFGETNEQLSKKIDRLIAGDVKPMLCVGETDAERSQGETKQVVGAQLEAVLKGRSPSELQGLVVAYEPVWAIGTGKSATPEDAQDVHCFIRGELARLIGATFAEDCRLLYGGSVKPSNAEAIFAQPDIDGGLIGGASLNADDFSQICSFAG